MKIEQLPQKCLVIFTTADCVKCKELLTIVDKCELGIDVIILDQENGQNLGDYFTIQVSPTVLLIENGREIDRFYGLKSVTYIEDFIN